MEQWLAYLNHRLMAASWKYRHAILWNFVWVFWFHALGPKPLHAGTNGRSSLNVSVCAAWLPAQGVLQPSPVDCWDGLQPPATLNWIKQV